MVSAEQARAARAAGAAFLVSPGATPLLLDAMAAVGLPFLPGCATASEAIALLERGIACAKLFPAEAAGGVALAGALAGPFPQLRLCPTGGIDPVSAPAYLRLPNVACVGGTWLAPEALLAAGDWSGVAALARAASELRPAVR